LRTAKCQLIEERGDSISLESCFWAEWRRGRR